MKALFRLFIVCLLSLCESQAFPPAPQHLFYGMIRDAYGNPLDDPDAEITLETPSGARVRAALRMNAEPGVNYYLVVPMDAGVTDEIYRTTALRPFVSFTIKVKSGNIMYVPMEMTGNLAKMGQPGQRTLLNLTLGEDVDGDGIPDAWERAMVGQSGNFQDFRPEDDADNDGLNNLAEYLAGTYAFDPDNGFLLQIGKHEENTALQFMAIRGRTYTILASDDLNHWTTLQFRLPFESATDPLHDNWVADDVKLTRVLPVEASRQFRFYKLLVR